jgi:hypothetical protein
MPRIPLLGGAYQSRAIIASSQRCINLYPEQNQDEQAPAPTTHFPTPGLVRRGTPPVEGTGRCSYRASNGELFCVVAGNVYFVNQFFAYTLLGTIPSLDTPVIMADNGLAVVLTDGTPTSYAINIQPQSAAVVPPAQPMHSFGVIADPTFIANASSGVSHVGYTDTFFVFNSSGQNYWFISLSLVTYGNLRKIDTYATDPTRWSFDPLDYVSKIGSADPVAGLACMHRNLWILGTLTGEAWYNSGSADFTFSALPGVYSERGCIAPYSIATEDNSVYWLARSRQGKCIALRWDASFQIEEISQPGIDAIFGSFVMCDDAIGGCYQLFGHTYYIVTFPTAGRSFACETKSKQWHELAWTGPNGLERHRSQGWCHAYDMALTIDRENGRLYQLDPHTFTDDGGPITRLRTIPHILNDGKRVRIDRVIADTQGGTLGGAVPGPYSRSIQDIITSLGLPAPKLLLEAGTLSSWPGSGQKWQDESGNGYDFFRGDDGTTGPRDPIFVGSIGGLSLSEYWTFPGPKGAAPGQWFTYDNPNEPWMDNLHKDGAKFTIVTLVYPFGPATAGSRFIGDSGGGIGIDFGIALTAVPVGVQRVRLWNGGPNAAQVFDSADVVPLNQWSVQGISIDETAAAGVSINAGAVRLFDSTYTAPSAANASFPMQIATSGGGGDVLSAGSRIAFMAIWEGVALTAAQLTSLNDAINANNLLPSPRFATPQIFLRVSYDRGGTFQDALPGSMGNEGEYGELPWWANLGMGRDVVFELSWSAPIDTALNGVFLEATPVGT